MAISGRVAIKKEKKEAEIRREDGRNGRMRGESMIVDAKNAFWLLSAGRRHNSRGDTIKNATPPGGRRGERERERIFARGIGREEGGEAIRKNLEVDSNRIIPRVFTLVMSSSLYRISSTRIKLRDLNDNRLISYYFA